MEFTKEDLEFVRKYFEPKNYEEYKEGLNWFSIKLGEQITEVFNKYVAEVKYAGSTK